MTARALRTQLVVILLVITNASWFGTATARQEVDLERDVLPAVVQIAVRVIEREGSLPADEQLIPRGTGSIISADGLVLTSAHVLDLTDLQERARAQEANYRAQGIDRTVSVTDNEYILLFSERDEPPVPRYTAKPEQVDDSLDLAVLRISGGSRNQPVGRLALPFVRLGNSDLVRRRDPISVVGYPGIASTSIIDDGSVNGFESEPGIPGRAWILTDAFVSGGSSGGAAVDSAGQLIGVITLATELDCRRDDTNGDGVIDESDLGCVPVGSALARLRPINLVMPLLADAGLTPTPVETEAAEQTSTPRSPTETPVPPPMTPTRTPTVPSTEHLRVILPTVFEVPAGLVQIEDVARSLAQASRVYSDPADMMARFTDWGWRGNVLRVFASEDADASPEQTTYLAVTVHEFGDVVAASEALDYALDDEVAAFSHQERAAPTIGNRSRVIAGRVGESNEVIVYVQLRNMLIVVDGVSLEGDPSADALTVAQTVVAKAGLYAGRSSGSVTDVGTMAPSGGRLVFRAEDWRGGLYRGDGDWYGRPWVAVYGAQSEYPLAALTFSLDSSPIGEATLYLTGLDDELPANARIDVAMNGASLYTGSSPFANWDGNMANQAADASWTQANFSVPVGLLVAGTNELTVANLEPSANFGVPPWVLLGDAVLDTT
jgi:S1-C subfamily serine protease